MTEADPVYLFSALEQLNILLYINDLSVATWMYMGKPNTESWQCNKTTNSIKYSFPTKIALLTTTTHSGLTMHSYPNEQRLAVVVVRKVGKGIPD